MTTTRFAILLWALILAAPCAYAQRAPDPSAATVLIRVIGDVHVEIDELGLGTTRAFDRTGVQLSSGSGFVVSSYGYIVTANHVVTEQQLTAQRGGATVRARFVPTRFEVALPKERNGDAVAPLVASIVATDRAADLALLFVTGTLPYVALGDSAALERGQQVQVVGYPFGDRLTALIGDTPSPSAPDVTVTRGSITALRTDASGDVELVQTDSTINPGTSGGPLVDADGFAIGVVVSQVTDENRNTGVGFAVPINVVKKLIDTQGLDRSLTARRLRVTQIEELLSKGVRVAMLEGRNDLSPSRVSVDLRGTDNDVSFRVDRVYSTWNAQELQRWLLDERGLEPAFSFERQRQSTVDASGRLHGRASGRDGSTGQAVELVYTIVDLGMEKLIARFIGATEQIAFNRSVVDGALAAFDATALLSGSSPSVPAISWTVGPFLSPDAPDVALPAGWLLERSSGAVCNRVPPATAIVRVSPPGDFRVSLRITWWPPGVADAKQIVTACGGGSSDRPSFSQRVSWAGVQYVSEGTVRTVDGGGVVQLTLTVPSTRLADGRAIFEQWERRVVR